MPSRRASHLHILQNLCASLLFLIIFVLPIFVNASVVINEIAWMGTANSSSDEWIELYNDGSEDIDISGWSLVAQDGSPSITFMECSTTTILANGYFLLERTDDESVLNVIADCIYKGAIENGGEYIFLKKFIWYSFQ